MIFNLSACRMAVLLAVATLAATASHALSTYTLTTLKPPTWGKVATTNSFAGHAFAIDEANRVVGSAAYYAGYYIDSNVPYFRTRYDPYVVRWAASTSASVSPSKIVKVPDWTYIDLSVSSDAGKVLMTSAGQVVVDTATMKAGPQIPVTLDAWAVNSAGTVIWNGKNLDRSFGTWTSAVGTLTYPLVQDGNGWGRLKALNNQGVVVGWTQGANDPLRRAAMWAGGQVSVLDARPGVGSEAILVNDAGTVVIQSLRPYCHGLVNCDSVNEAQGILSNGVFTPFKGAAAADPSLVAAQALNNKGVVAGYINPASQDPEGRRGFVWRDNTLSDVTNLLRSKGVTLPSAAVITNVLAINDQGSMVASMKTSSGMSLVRLTAVP